MNKSTMIRNVSIIWDTELYNTKSPGFGVRMPWIKIPEFLFNNSHLRKIPSPFCFTFNLSRDIVAINFFSPMSSEI